MSNTAHSDFFGLDLGVGFAPLYQASDEVLDRAQENLQKWSEVASKSDSPSVSPRSMFAGTSLPPTMPGMTSINPEQALQGSSVELSTVKNAKVQKTFHFVANSDKKTATRLRNTLTSRNLRQSKVSRIAELERALERQQQETELWRNRAFDSGWKQ